MSEVFSLASASLLPLALACLVAFLASILGGLSGYGTGLILPVFLSPLVGVENVIPVMAVGMLINNGSRVIAFRRDIQWVHARQLLVFGLPACVAGAYGYTLLSGPWISCLLGAFLLVVVPLRRILNRAQLRLSVAGERGAGVVFGFINGGMTGAGVLLIAILMSADVAGAALIATDAVVSAIMGLSKVVLFSGFARLDFELAAIGLLIGLSTAPGAFVARRLLNRIPVPIHASVMEVVVVTGAVVLLWNGLFQSPR